LEIFDGHCGIIDCLEWCDRACKLKGMAIETKVCIDISQVQSLLIQMWKVLSHIL
jgi:hypothetical protein